jgi:hypothetical protein
MSRCGEYVCGEYVKPPQTLKFCRDPQHFDIGRKVSPVASAPESHDDKR